MNEQLRGTNYSRYDVSSDRKDRGVLFNINRELHKNNTLTAGFEYKRGSVEGGDYFQTPRLAMDGAEVYDTVFNAGTINTLAGYIQDEHAFYNNKIRLVLGLRFDNVTFDDGKYYSTNPWNTVPELKKHTWTELSPRLGMRFNFIDQVSAYISYSHGFRASILDDLTRTGWMWIGPKYANPELDPESLDNFELGVDIVPFEKLKVSTSVFYASGKDFLYFVATKDSLFGRSIYRRENVTGVTLKGVETDIRYQISDGLNILASYTYADSKVDEFTERPELENKNLKYVPKHAASASIFWKNRYFNTSLRAYYKGEQYGDDLNKLALDPYSTIDVQLSKQISENYIFSLDIQDVFDNQHLETIDYLSPGRIITCRMALKF